MFIRSLSLRSSTSKCTAEIRHSRMSASPSEANTSRKRNRSPDVVLHEPSLLNDSGILLSSVERQLKDCQALESEAMELNVRRMASIKQIDFLQQASSNVAVLRLNVGGKLFSVPVDTLVSRDNNSYFHSLLEMRENPFVQIQLDGDGNIFIDRDPDVFVHIVNYLRGYEKFGKVEGTMLKKLRIDAAYYRLFSLLHLIEDDKRDQIRFRDGPGVNPDGDRLRVAFGVAVVGNHDLVTGKHSISFQVVADEYVGIGLVSDACVNKDHEFHKTPGCSVYYMSGVFYSNYPHHKKEEASDTIVRFGSGDRIDVSLNMEKGYAEFTIKNVSKLISIGRTKRLRFAVTAKANSTVRILPQSA